MPAILNPIITDAGLAAAVNAKANGLQLAITHVALGTGKYTADVSTVSGMTAMVGRKEQVLPGAGNVSGSGGFVLTVRFAAWAGTPSSYSATELGFYAGDPDAGGVLFAVYSHPTDVIVTRNSLEYLASFVMQLTRVPAGSVTVNLDPDAVQWQAMLNTHLAASDPHTQYVRKIGDTSSGPQLGVTATQHDHSKKFATTEFVNRVGLSYPRSGGIGLNSSPFNLTPDMCGSWMEAQVNGGTINLPSAASVAVGACFAVRCAVSTAMFSAAGGDAILSPNNVGMPVYPMTQGEIVTFTRNGGGAWYVTGHGQRLPAGMTAFFAGDVTPAGWVHLNGALLSRAAYPFLWAYAQSQAVTEASWQSGYFGRFSTGTTGDNFRLPDTRGTFLRALDDGRGYDSNREWGRFQDQANVSHAHGVYDPGHGHGVTDAGHGHSIYDPTHGHNIYDPGHKHIAPYGESHTGPFGQSSTKGYLGSGDSDYDNYLYNTARDVTGIGIYGSNTGISINVSNSNISVNGNTTGIGIYGEGAADGRPRNLAYRLCVKF